MSARADPLVTVIVPVFNGGSTLARTLESVRRQLFTDFECVIVDDGSEDGSAMIAERLCNLDARFRLLRQPNLGVARARNAGLAVARGRYIAALDADDLWHPQFLARHLTAWAGAPPDTGFTYSLARGIDAEDRVTESLSTHVLSGRIGNCLRYSNICGNPSMVVLDRQALEEIGGYEAKLRDAGCEGSEDWLVLLSVASNRTAIAIPAYLSGYRQIPGSMSSNWSSMIRSFEYAEQIFAQRKRGAPAPNRIVRWQRGSRELHYARSAARNWQPGRFLWHFVHSLCADPVRLLAMLLDVPVRAWRIARHRRTARFEEYAPDDDHASFAFHHPLKYRVMAHRLRGLME